MSRNKEENFHGATEKHYYLGNKNLPRGTAEFEWTPEMMHHLKNVKKIYYILLKISFLLST